jgi:hypothetical protein
LSEIISDLQKRLDAVCDSLDVQVNEFEEAAKLCVEAIHGMHLRMERIEKWIAESKNLKQMERIKAPMIGEPKKIPKKRSNPWKSP